MKCCSPRDATRGTRYASQNTKLLVLRILHFNLNIIHTGARQSTTRGFPSLILRIVSLNRLVSPLACQVERQLLKAVASAHLARRGKAGHTQGKHLNGAICATMVHLRLNEKEATRNPHINFIRALPEFSDEDEALTRLTQLAALFRPIMKEYGLSINSLVEVRH